MGTSASLEDLLYEIHQAGLFEEVLKEIKEIKKDKKFISSLESYELAYENVKSRLENEKEKKHQEYVDYIKNLPYTEDRVGQSFIMFTNQKPKPDKKN